MWRRTNDLINKKFQVHRKLVRTYSTFRDFANFGIYLCTWKRIKKKKFSPNQPSKAFMINKPLLIFFFFKSNRWNIVEVARSSQFIYFFLSHTKVTHLCFTSVLSSFSADHSAVCRLTADVRLYPSSFHSFQRPFFFFFNPLLL